MRVASVCVAAVTALSGCAPEPQPLDRPAEERAIRELEARWLKAANDRDAAAQAAMYAPDGIAYRNGEEPLVGPAAIERWERPSAATNPKAVLTYAMNQLFVGAAGDVAVETGIGTMTSLGPNGEDRKIHRSTLVTVWKKVNGEWKVWQDIASDVP